MAQQATSSIEGSLQSLTETAAECVSLVPTALTLYADGDPGFGDVVERVLTLESRCDEHVQSLRRELAATGPAFTDPYIFGPDVLELAYDVDRVASEAEQFLAELQAIEPDLSPATLSALGEHARRSAAACDRLRRGINAALTDEPCGDDVDAIRAEESACDRLKYQVLATTDGPQGWILLVREFAVLADAVPNAIEDAADRLGQVRTAGV